MHQYIYMYIYVYIMMSKNMSHKTFLSHMSSTFGYAFRFAMVMKTIFSFMRLSSYNICVYVIFVNSVQLVIVKFFLYLIT